jgi:hypothetical protein
VLAALGEGPYRVVAPIVHALHDQLYAQQSEPIPQRSDNVFSMEAGE